MDAEHRKRLSLRSVCLLAEHSMLCFEKFLLHICTFMLFSLPAQVGVSQLVCQVCRGISQQGFGAPVRCRCLPLLCRPTLRTCHIIFMFASVLHARAPLRQFSVPASPVRLG